MNAVGVLYEWEPWASVLCRKLIETGTSVERLPVDSIVIEPGHIPDCRVFVNRVNVQPAGGTDPRFVFLVLEFLEELERNGAKILNGSRAFRVAMSKALQVSVFRDVGVEYPNTRIVGSPARAIEVAKDLRFPLIVKPNIGGSGAGIRIFENLEEMASAVSEGLSFGVDGVGVVQEYHLPQDGRISRVEILDNQVLYATRQNVKDGVFNYCAVDGCGVGTGGGETRIESFQPNEEMAEISKRIVASARADVAGVEFVTSARDGRRYVFDINPYSNLAAPEVLGFDPHDRLVESVCRMMA